jgi:hypothetical protein
MNGIGSMILKFHCVIRWMEEAGPSLQSHLAAETKCMQRTFSSGLAESQRVIQEEAQGILDEGGQVRIIVYTKGKHGTSPHSWRTLCCECNLPLGIL